MLHRADRACLRSTGTIEMPRPRNVPSPRLLPVGASAPFGNGFARFAAKVNPVSNDGTRFVDCEKPVWLIASMMNGTAKMPNPPRRTVISFSAYANPTRGSKTVLSAFQNVRFAASAYVSPPRTWKFDGESWGTGFAA